MVQSLLFTSHIFGAESAGGGISALGVDAKDLLIQIITFLIVFWLLKRFAFQRIVKILEERRKVINQGVELGRKMAKEQEQVEAQVAAMMAKARTEADKIIAAGHQDARELIKAAEAAAARKTDAMLVDAQARIKDDIDRARRNLEKDMLSLVAEATEVVIGEKMDARRDTELIDRAIRKAERV